jgi:ribosomal protein S18 acetylase RimI-like enzyme
LVARPFTRSDLSRLRLDLHPRLDEAEAREVLARRPEGSFWLTESEEFILVDQWRHRAEMSTIHTFGAFANEDLLMGAVMDTARAAGQSAMVVVDVNETRPEAFFNRHGFDVEEQIVTYSHQDLRRGVAQFSAPHLTFERVPVGESALLTAVVAVDHASFPWFWWNSVEEFLQYLDYPGVDVWAGRLDGEVVAYAGVTRYHGWAHLDRIATRADRQGHGLGRDMLAHVMREVARRGARSLALSTQEHNRQSRRLYERAGFEPTPQDDYRIHIASFDDARVLEGMWRP